MRFSLFALLFAPLASAADLPKGVFDRVGGGTFQHPDRPLALDYSPDGKHLASGGSDGTVRIWDAGRQTLLHTLSVKGGIVTGLRYSADGKNLFVHFGDDKLRRYDADAAYKLLDTTAARHLDQLSATADGSLVAGVEAADKVKVIETKTGLDRLDLPDGRAACVFPDGSAVACVTADGGVQVYEVPSGKPLHAFPAEKDEKNKPGRIAVSPNGRRIAVAPEWQTGSVRVYEVGSDKPVAAFDGEGAVRFAGNDLVCVTRRGRVVVYDVKAQAVAAEFGDRVGAFAVSADGKTVATDSGGGVGSARLRVWEVAKGAEVRVAADELRGMLGTAPGPDGTAWLVTSGGVHSWRPGEKPTAAANFPRPATAFAATADALFVADPAGLTRLDAKNPAAEGKAVPAFPAGAVHLAVSGDGRHLAAVFTDPEPRLTLTDADGGNVRGWPLPSPALGVAVSPDGKAVAVLGRDGQVRAWDATAAAKNPAERWKKKVARGMNGGIAFTPDGTQVVTATMLKVLVWEAAAGELLAGYERTWDDGPFVSVAVSPDGRLIAAGTLGTNGLAVWERESGAVVKRLSGTATTLWHLSFAADGRTLLACGGDDAALAWDVSGRRGKGKPTADEVTEAWEALGRTPEAAWQAEVVLRDTADPFAVIAAGTASARRVFADVDANLKLLADPDFATRKKANAAVLAAGVTALPAVKAFADKTDVPEAKRLADELVEKLTPSADDPKRTERGDELVRLGRAVRLAERLGGPKATAALDDLAKFGGEVGKAAEDAKKRVKK